MHKRRPTLAFSACHPQDTLNIGDALRLEGARTLPNTTLGSESGNNKLTIGHKQLTSSSMNILQFRNILLLCSFLLVAGIAYEFGKRSVNANNREWQMHEMGKPGAMQTHSPEVVDFATNKTLFNVAKEPIANSSQPHLRLLHAMNAIDRASFDDLVQILTQSRTVNGLGLTLPEIELIVGKMAESDPGRTIAIIQSDAFGPFAKRAMQLVLTIAGNNNPELMGKIQSLPEDLRAGAIKGLINKEAAQGFDSLVNALSAPTLQLAEMDDYMELMSSVSSERDGGSEKLQLLIENQEVSTAAKEAAASVYVQKLAGQEPEKVGNMLVQNINSDGITPRIIRDYMEELAAIRSYEAGAQWLVKNMHTNPSKFDDGLAQCVTLWSSRNANEVAAWLTQQKGQAYYDRAAASFVQSINGYDAEAAAGWANTIESEELRSAATRESAGVIRLGDKTAIFISKD
jgi:hypothetical protein